VEPAALSEYSVDIIRSLSKLLDQHQVHSPPPLPPQLPNKPSRFAQLSSWKIPSPKLLEQHQLLKATWQITVSGSTPPPIGGFLKDEVPVVAMRRTFASSELLDIERSAAVNSSKTLTKVDEDTLWNAHLEHEKVFYFYFYFYKSTVLAR
jgi:hypothetical protein